MRRRTGATAVALGVLAGISVSLLVIGLLPTDRPSPRPSRSWLPSARPLAFESNEGQADPGAEYVARGPGLTALFTPTEALLGLRERTGATVSLALRPLGANPRPLLAPGTPRTAVTNYLRGGPAPLQLTVPTYGEVRYAEVYPGIDLVFSDNAGQLQHDFVVGPEADPSQILVQLRGADRVRTDRRGDLVVEVDGAAEPVVFARPVLYQERGDRRTSVTGRFRVHGPDTFGFEVGRYDRDHTLVIDPTLLGSSYLGGGATDNAMAVAVDGQGSVYVAGFTVSGDFPLASAAQSRLNVTTPPSPDGFVAKMTADGSQLLWSTYLGGSGGDEARAIGLGADGSVFVAGTTSSSDFPRGPAPQGGFGGGTSDAFVAKLNADGATLAYSFFVGGVGTDLGRALAIDRTGRAHVAGQTNSNDFPALNGLPAPPATNGDDVFVARVNAAGTAYEYASRFGGGGVDVGAAIAVAPDGSIVVTGTTSSPEFPTVKPLQGAFGSGPSAPSSDAFVTKIAPDGKALTYSTFLGGALADQGAAIAVDADGAAYVSGTTSSPDFPTVNPLQGERNGTSDAFVAKVNPDGAGLAYSTYLGGSGVDGASGLTLNAGREVWVVGTTGSTDFETAQPLQREPMSAEYEVFLSKLDAAGAVLQSSTYLGGSGEELANGVALAGEDRAVVVGTTDSTDLPGTPEVTPYQAATGGGTDGFLALVSEAGGLSTGSSAAGHQRRVQLLVATTSLLLLTAVFQTLHLRRHSGRDEGWRLPVALPGRQEDDLATVPGDDWGSPMTRARSSGTPLNILPHDVPLTGYEHDELLDPEEDASFRGIPSGIPSGIVAAPAPSPAAAPRADDPVATPPIDDTGFWDLFPDHLPATEEPPTEAWTVDLAAPPPEVAPAAELDPRSDLADLSLWAPPISRHDAPLPDVADVQAWMSELKESRSDPSPTPRAPSAPPAAPPVSGPPAAPPPAPVPPVAPPPVATPQAPPPFGEALPSPGGDDVVVERFVEPEDEPASEPPPAAGPGPDDAPAYEIESVGEPSHAGGAPAPLPTPLPPAPESAPEPEPVASRPPPLGADGDRLVQELMTVDFGATGETPRLTADILAIQWDLDLDLDEEPDDLEALDDLDAAAALDAADDLDADDTDSQGLAVDDLLEALDEDEPVDQAPADPGGPAAATGTTVPAAAAPEPEPVADTPAPPGDTIDDPFEDPVGLEDEAGEGDDARTAARKWWKELRSRRPPF